MRRLLAAAMSGIIGATAAELNVRHVVLFKHGVGFFERAGELGPGEGARLDFKAQEMNDVLKSLTVDVKGGGVAGLRYDSSEPLDKKLEQFPMKLGAQQPLAAVLDQLKGARLEVSTGAGPAAGAIVSARVVPAGREQSEREQVTLLLDSGELRTVDLAAVTAVKFPDARVQTQFKDYLATLVQARSSDKRSVYLDSSDAGRRQVSASYMIPMPVWKSSYRLIFPASGDPVLEGWAIVDNTTSEDWNRVNLSLVSGRPISFISRLYEPKYIERQVAELAEDQAVAPVVYEAAMASAVPAPAVQMGARRKMAAAPAGMVGGVAESVEVPVYRAEASTLTQTAEGREMGELFEYRFSTPVTVRKNESAMLPFLQQKTQARKLLIWSGSGANPMNAAEITNSTGKTLDGGPITVYDGGGYAGEALVETVKQNDKRLISYGVDIGTRVTTAFDSSAQVVREVSMRRGLLTTRAAIKETLTYTVRNVDSKAKTLIIEHPVRYGYRFLGDAKPVESTQSKHRFQVALAAGATEKFPVEEERLLEQTYAVTSLTPDFLASVVSNKALSANGRRQLEAVLTKKREIAQANGDSQRAESERAELEKDQERVRQNLTALNRVTGQQDQVNRYAQQLSGTEAQLAALRDRASELKKKKAALESELAALIEKMEF